MSAARDDEPEAPSQPRADLLIRFVRHPVAANLLMAVCLVLGLVALGRINTQFFPDFHIDWITTTVTWPGASAEDVDRNIIGVIEPEVRDIDGVKRLTSQSAEGVGLVALEFKPGTDMQSALSDVESAIARLSTLPEDIERPIIARVSDYETVGRLVVSGEHDEAAVKATAKRIRDELLDAGITKVELIGARDEEIRVEVEPGVLRQLDLTPVELARRIGERSFDLPSGTLPAGAERQIRSLGLAETAEDVGALELKSGNGTQRLPLREVARISETFDEDQAVHLRKGRPAVEIRVLRAPSADAIEESKKLDAYVEALLPTLAPTLKVERYDNVAEMIDSRINLLLTNGLQGLVLVVVVLFLFLSARVAFWIALGIPTSLFVGLAVMLWSGQTIDMVSLFALILMVGIIVDDAIVVGEHAVTLRERGMAPTTASELSPRRMFWPVMAATTTTAVAFAPLLMIGDVIGQIISAIPMVVIAVLIGSTLECFLILPRHLRGPLGKVSGQHNRFNGWFLRGFARFREGPFRRLVKTAIAWRYLTLAIAVSTLIFCFGLVAGGRLSFVFFPSPESDTVFANVSFAEGTKRETTLAMANEMERALYAAEAKLNDGKPGVVSMAIVSIGAPVGRSDGFFLGTSDNLGAVQVELAPSNTREVRTAALIEAWRDEIRMAPGIETLSIVEQQSGPPGREIDIRAIGTDLDALKAASLDVRELLGRFPGVSDLSDDMPLGKEETILELNARGRALGFTIEGVARQVRGAFEGAIAKRFGRGDEEVTVRVMLAKSGLDSSQLRNLYVLSPEGLEVPLAEIVTMREGVGFSRINREGGKRQIAITGEVDETVTTNNKILEAAREAGLAEIGKRHGVQFAFKGKAEEQANTIGDMQTGTMVALVAIYIILAWVFRSYWTPIGIMAVIPFGLVGALLGHYLLGFDLTVLSMVALLGLSGIVVNDSIVLVEAYQERRAAGESVYDALVNASCDRLRAVLLTSVTTIFGIVTLLFETDLQAQFLKPMAVTIVFGLMATTIIVLVLVPVVLMIVNDLARLFGRERPLPARETRALQPGE